MPLRTIIAVLTSAPVAEATSELAAKPVASGDFATATLDAQKVAALIVITNELARSAAPSSLNMLGNELRRAAGIAVDVKFLELMAATPGITSAATTGVTATAVLADLAAALDRLTIGADSRLWLITSPKLAKVLALLPNTGGFMVQDGKIGPISLAPSDAATTTAYLIDAYCCRTRCSEAGQHKKCIFAIKLRPDVWRLSTGKFIPTQLNWFEM